MDLTEKDLPAQHAEQGINETNGSSGMEHDIEKDVAYIPQSDEDYVVTVKTWAVVVVR